jgi:hypothetical protein
MDRQVDLTESTLLSKILQISGQKVMLDRDLAELYGVTTKRLNEQVKRIAGAFLRNSCFSSIRQKRRRWSQFATTSGT